TPITRSMSKKIKKFIFPSAALIASFYASVIFAIGVIIGYIGINLFCKKLVHTGKIKRVVLDYGNYNIYFHHWIIGLFILLVGFISQIIYTAPIFWIGCVGGLIFHDIYTDKKWYKVIHRKIPR
ncbi:hypothetical protein KJ841_01295, partial [Patescibacteria group bacterium]|nr:hypothetical protein [Patescibacteria group bacterium]